jgi:hypothetical protein
MWGASLPIILSSTMGDGASTGYGTGRTQGVQESFGRTVGRAHTDGQTDATSWAKSHTTTENWGEASTSGSSWGHSVTQTTGIADGTSHVASQAHGTASTHGSGSSSGSSWGSSTAFSHGGAFTQSAGGSVGFEGTGLNVNYAVTESIGRTDASSVGGFSSSSSFDSTTNSNSWGVADGTSHVVSQGTAVSDFSGGFSSPYLLPRPRRGRYRDHGRLPRRQPRRHPPSHALSTAYARGSSTGLTQGQALNTFQGLGLGAGVAPSISFSKVFQGEDHVAKMIADALRGQEEMLQVMALEGGYYVDNYFLCGDARGTAGTRGACPPGIPRH